MLILICHALTLLYILCYRCFLFSLMSSFNAWSVCACLSVWKTRNVSRLVKSKNKLCFWTFVNFWMSRSSWSRCKKFPLCIIKRFFIVVFLFQEENYERWQSTSKMLRGMIDNVNNPLNFVEFAFHHMNWHFLWFILNSPNGKKMTSKQIRPSLISYCHDALWN